MNHKSLRVYAVVFAMIAIFGCRGGNEVVVDDEGVVDDEAVVDDGGVVDDEAVTPDASIVEKWINPVDIGEAYPPVGELKTGDIVVVSPRAFARVDRKYEIGFIVDEKPDDFQIYVEGEVDDLLNVYLKKHPVRAKIDYITTWNGLTYIQTYTFKRRWNADGKWEWVYDERLDWGGSARRRVKPGFVSFVILSEWDDDSDDINLAIGLDRTLEYNLLIYLELQTQNVAGEVRRERVFRLVPKDTPSFHLDWENVPTDEFPWIRIGDKGEYVKASVSILSHTEMEKIALPISIDVGTKNIVIPAGHTFRPYRILSPSYKMYEASEENW